MSTTDSDYEWQEGWADLPDDPAAKGGWAHHGMGVLSDGLVVAFHPGESTLLFFQADGKLARTVDVEVGEAHGLTVVIEDGQNRLWIADPGVKVRKQHHHEGDGDGDPTKQFDVAATGGKVLKVSLDGTVLQRIERAPRPEYENGGYAPTWVAVDEERLGGTGDIWVADGYGSSLVHRYTADGTYVSTISGEEGEAGRFNCPHAVFIDRRGADAVLLVADRGNARIQEYGLDGTYRQVLGVGVLNSPSALATSGDLLVVAELNARIAILDRDGAVVSYEGENGDATTRPGWPNALDEKGNVVAPTTEPGRFNSPHGLTVDADGNIYVAEWLLGGRHIRLAP
jgi:DNA-binding beta-propeller fold protein YncE